MSTQDLTTYMEPNVMFLEKALDGRVTMDDISDALEEYTRLHKAGIASPAEILTLSRAYPENPIYAKALKKMNVNDDDSLVIGGPASIELVDREGHLITTAALDNAFQKYMSNFRTRNAMVLHSDVQVGWALPAYISKGGQIFKSGVDDKGLFFITELRNDTKIAKKVMEQINEGRLKSYSIAGSAVKTQTIQKGLQSVMQVDEMELAEVTVCEKGVNQGASFDIIKAENAATQSCVDGSCLIQKEESCGCESEPLGAEMIYKQDGDIDFLNSLLNFIKDEPGSMGIHRTAPGYSSPAPQRSPRRMPSPGPRRPRGGAGTPRPMPKFEREPRPRPVPLSGPTPTARPGMRQAPLPERGPISRPNTTAQVRPVPRPKSTVREAVLNPKIMGQTARDAGRAVTSRVKAGIPDAKVARGIADAAKQTARDAGSAAKAGVEKVGASPTGKAVRDAAKTYQDTVDATRSKVIGGARRGAKAVGEAVRDSWPGKIYEQAAKGVGSAAKKVLAPKTERLKKESQDILNESIILQKLLQTLDNPEGTSFPTLINTQARQDEHHRLLDRYGFPEEIEPEFARYTPVVEYNPLHSSPPWVVNEAGQN